MQGAAGLKRILILGACAAALFGALLAASPRAEATPLTSYSGRLYAVSTNPGTHKAQIFTRKSGSGWNRIRYLGNIWGRNSLGSIQIDADRKGRFVIVCGGAGLYKHYVYRISTDGGKAVKLSGSLRCYRNASLSPDGSKVAFFSDGGASPGSLYVVSSSGGNPRLLARKPVCGVSGDIKWAAGRIYFNGQNTHCDVLPELGVYASIFSVRASDGRGFVQHVDPPEPYSNDPTYAVQDVSPDGGRILAVRGNDYGGQTLVELSPAGRTEIQTVGSYNEVMLFNWALAEYSPDANRVAFVRPWGSGEDPPFHVTLSGPLSSLIIPFPLANAPESAPGGGMFAVDWARK